MFTRLRRSLTVSNTVAFTALFVALGGSSYAALSLPRDSVGANQIRSGAVRSAEVKNRSLLAQDFKPGQLPRGATGPAGPAGALGPIGPRGLTGRAGRDGRDVTSERFSFGQGRGDVPGATLGSDGAVGVTVRTAGSRNAQIVIRNVRSTGNIIGSFQLYNRAAVPFSANPGQTIVTGDAAVSALFAGHFTVTITDQDLASTYRLDCIATAIGGNPIIRCYGTRSRVG